MPRPATSPARWSSAADDCLAAHADTAQRLVTAIAAGMKLIHTEPGACEAASAKAFPQVPPDAIRLGMATLLGLPGVVSRNPVITRVEWEAVLAIETGVSLKQTLPFERMVDNSFPRRRPQPPGCPVRLTAIACNLRRSWCLSSAPVGA